MKKFDQLEKKIPGNETPSLSEDTLGGEIFMFNNRDLRIAANQAGWGTQDKDEQQLSALIQQPYGKTIVKAIQRSSRS